jgi:BRCT domain type II-containing protein
MCHRVLNDGNDSTQACQTFVEHASDELHGCDVKHVVHRRQNARQKARQKARQAKTSQESKSTMKASWRAKGNVRVNEACCYINNLQ